MSIAIKTGEKRDWITSPNIEGEAHDHCPSCDTDVEASDGFGGEHGVPRMWSQYVHDRRNGGCGATWTRTTRFGLERNDSHDQRTKWLTGSAETGRVWSMPSKAYEDAYERIFKHS